MKPGPFFIVEFSLEKQCEKTRSFFHSRVFYLKSIFDKTPSFFYSKVFPLPWLFSYFT
eukprot:UN05568